MFSRRKVDTFGDTMIKNFPHQPDEESLYRTSLHIAAENGTPQFVEKVLKEVTDHEKHARDKHGNTALHVAASCGHVTACALLVAHGLKVDECNINGKTPLHLAASSSLCFDALKSLVECNGNLDSKDAEGNSPLVIAIGAKNKPGVKLLLNKGASLTLVNHAGITPFGVAADNGHEDMCIEILSHERWQQALGSDCYAQQMVVEKLIETMPKVCELILDKCITFSNHHADHPDLSYTCNYSLMEPILDGSRKGGVLNLLATKMIKFERKELILHPVTVHYLRLKWKVLGRYFYYTSFVLYLAYLVGITSLIVMEHHRYIDAFVANPQKVAPTSSTTAKSTTRPNTTSQPILTNTLTVMTTFAFQSTGTVATSGLPSSSGSSSTGNQMALSDFGTAVTILTLIFSIVMLIKEFVEMFFVRLKYFKDFTNFVEMPLYVCSLIYMLELTIQLGWRDINSKYQLGILTVFFGFFNLMLYLQRMSFFQLYVVMYLKVIGTLVQVIVVFFLPIFGFALTFYLMFPKLSTYSSIPRSTAKVFMMLSGEIDYEDLFVGNIGSVDSTTKYPKVPFVLLSFFMEVFFLLILVVGLMNLLVGLAVGDIETIRKDANMKVKVKSAELAQQIHNYMPKVARRMFYKASQVIFPNRRSTFQRFLAVLMLETQDYREAMITVKRRLEDLESKSLVEKMKFKEFQRMEAVQKKVDNLVCMVQRIHEKLNNKKLK